MKEYIEREAVLERLAKVDMDTYYGFTAAVQFGVNHAIQCIKEAPAADVVEVRRGRWVKRQNPQWKAYYHDACSICGWWNTKNSMCYNRKKKPGHSLNYCPNCGARMGKEDEHEAG